MTLVAGESVMLALTPPVFQRLAELGESLRSRLRAALEGAGVPAQVTGIASLFGVHFTSRPIRSYRDVVAADAEMARAVFTGMLNEGILLQTSGAGSLGIMTGAAEIDTLVDAFARVAARVR